MAEYMARQFSGMQDFAAMIGLIKQRPLQRVHRLPTEPDLYEHLADPGVRENTRLWYDHTGMLAGFALLYRPGLGPVDFLLWETKQEVAYDIQPQIITWGLQAESYIPYLQVDCSAEDTDRITLLETMGFRVVQGTIAFLNRPLSIPIAEPALPDGFVIRPLMGKAEAAAWVKLCQATGIANCMSVATRKALMDAPGYIPQLDLVAVAPDGRLIAFCISEVKKGYGDYWLGYTEPVGTHPRYRQHGLARALLLTATRLLAERGICWARLTTDGNNLAMQNAALSAGFMMDTPQLGLMAER
jgi:GNAT superfamily N-acetyltransferase